MSGIQVICHQTSFEVLGSYTPISLPYTFFTLTNLHVSHYHQLSGGSHQPALCISLTQPFMHCILYHRHLGFPIHLIRVLYFYKLFGLWDIFEVLQSSEFHQDSSSAQPRRGGEMLINIVWSTGITY